MKQPDLMPDAPDDIDESIIHDLDLRAEDRAAKVPDRFAEMDAKDRAGPHY